MTGPRIVGEAAVRIVPDAEGWAARAEAQLGPEADELGRRLGQTIGEHLYRQVADAIDEIDARLAALGSRDVDIRLRVDDNGSLAAAAGQVEAVNAAANNSSGGIGALSGRLIGLGAAAIAGADLAIPAILAIGAAAGGLLAGIGVGVLGLSGIGQALQAKGSPFEGGGGGGGGGGQSAQQASIAAQQRRLAAEQATRSAQDQLTRAERDQAKAELDLHDARAQALLDLQALDNEVRDNALNQQQASINLAEAKKTLAQMLAAPGANLPQYADQIAQARLNVADAQQKQTELSEKGKQLAAQDAAAHKAGVEGSAKVLAAKQALIDANHKLAEAQQNVRDTALQNKLAAEAAAASTAAAAGAADKYAQAMAKLNPLQQQFVEFLLTLKPLLDEVKLAASQFLPGLEQGIKDALPAFQPFLQLVGNVAKALGAVFTEWGKALGSQQGQQFMTFLSKELPKQVGFLGKLFLDFGEIFAKIFEAAAPLIDAFDRALLAFFDSVNRAAGSNGLKAFFDSLIPLVGPLLRALTALGQLVSSVLVAIEPALGPLLNVITLIAKELASLAKPVLEPLAKAFGDLLVAVSPLIPVIGNMIKAVLPPLISLLDTIIKSGIAPLAVTIAKALMPLMGPLAQAFTQLVDAVAPLVAPLVQQIAPIIAPLAKDLFNMFPAFLQLVTAVVPLVPPLARIAGDLLTMAVKALPLVLPGLQALMLLATPLVKALTPFLNVLADILDKITGIVNRLPDLGGLLGGGSGGGGWFSGLLGAIGGGGLLSGLGNLLGGHAGGGNVAAGVPTWVGEAGKEIFVPRVPGTIIPADASRIVGKALQNRPSRTNNFTVYANDPLAAAHAVATRLAARGI